MLFVTFTTFTWCTPPAPREWVSLAMKMIDCKGNHNIKGYFDPYLNKEVTRFFCLPRRLSEDTHDKLSSKLVTLKSQSSVSLHQPPTPERPGELILKQNLHALLWTWATESIFLNMNSLLLKWNPESQVSHLSCRQRAANLLFTTFGELLYVTSFTPTKWLDSWRWVLHHPLQPH